MNYNNDFHEVLKGLVCSKLRRKILSSLDQPKRLCELKDLLNTNAPNTSAKAKDLQDAGFIGRDNGDYYITETGRIVNGRLSLLFDTIESVMRHAEFWSQLIDKLPKEIVENIHLFKNAELIKNDRNELDKVLRVLLRLMDCAEGELKLVLPANSKEMLAKTEYLSKRINTKVVTLHDDPELRYGLISSKNFIAIFTEIMDMALISNSIQLRSSSSKTCKSP